MSADVVHLNVQTSLPIPPERVLQCAIDAKLEEVIVIGEGDNNEGYLAFSHTDGDRLIALLEITKARLVGDRLKRVGLL